MSNRFLSLRRLRQFRRNRLPGQLIIQMTERCNGHCPQCGMRASERFTRATLPEADMIRILDAAARKDFTSVSFTGGEPLLMLDQLVDYLRYAGSLGIPYIRTGTNGFLFRDSDVPDFEDRIKRIAERLAATPLRNLWISVDSAHAGVHETMRGFPGVIAGIEKALPIFHEHGIYPSANLGINRNIDGEATAGLTPASFDTRADYLAQFYVAFKSAFRKFYSFVADLGFTMASACYPMSLDEHSGERGLAAAYTATSPDRVIRFERDEKATLFKALLEVVPEFRGELRVITPRSSLYALRRQYEGRRRVAAYPCRGGIDFFFIDAKSGNTYPCGYRGNEDLGKLWDLDLRTPPTQLQCLACDWECFRDPSEVLGPFAEGLTNPLTVLRRFWRDGAHFSYWLSDLRYARACSLFDGRQAPDYRRMAPFQAKLRAESELVRSYRRCLTEAPSSDGTDSRYDASARAPRSASKSGF